MGTGGSTRNGGDPHGGRPAWVLLGSLARPKHRGPRAERPPGEPFGPLLCAGGSGRWSPVDGSPGLWRRTLGAGEDPAAAARGFADALGPRPVRLGLGAGGEPLAAASAAWTEAFRADRHLVVRGLGESADECLSALGELLGALREGWTRRQAEVVALVRERSQREVSEQLGVRPSVVSEVLKSARGAAYLRAEAALSRALARALSAAR